jgi:hypothetical protein
MSSPIPVDRSAYSEDGIYRWFFTRRWAPGPSFCWVGLNPGTGDRDGGPRPTLRKVILWAKDAGCGAVSVVNLFSYRATDPKELLTDGVDVVGIETDSWIQSASEAANVTLVAWGGNKLAAPRAKQVLELVSAPVCVGVTKNGQPSHPLYVPQVAPLVPYRPRDPR